MDAIGDPDLDRSTAALTVSTVLKRLKIRRLRKTSGSESCDELSGEDHGEQ
jgi:hypothetical protein